MKQRVHWVPLFKETPFRKNSEPEFPLPLCKFYFFLVKEMQSRLKPTGYWFDLVEACVENDTPKKQIKSNDFIYLHTYIMKNIIPWH